MSTRLCLIVCFAIASALAGCGSCGSNATPDTAGACPAPLLPDDSTCTDHGECCSGFCDGGTCKEGNCDGFGASCATGATCCSGQCADDGTGVFSCVAGISACEPAGAQCATAADCCSLGCSGGVCVDTLCTSAGGNCGANSDCCGNNCQGTCQGGGACKPAGEDCTTGGAQSCCSGACVAMAGGMHCAAAPLCRVEGDVCSDNTDCCNFTCTSGKCEHILTQPACSMVGEPCVTDTTCCGFTCRDWFNTGVQTCQYLGGCRPYGELCRKDTDCCNNAATGTPGVCVIYNQAAGVGRCANPEGCAPTGEVCGTSDGGPSGSNQCCPQPVPAGDPNPCVQTQPTGTYRCFGCFIQGTTCTDNADCCNGTCTNGTCGCTPTTGPCQTATECCGGVCAPDANGTLVCSPGCIMDGQSCTANTDCCGGVCDPQTLMCGTIIL